MKKSRAFREEVKNKIDELLFEVQDRDQNSSIDDISEKIVSMICDPLGVWYREKESSNRPDDDFSEKKERWIAP